MDGQLGIFMCAHACTCVACMHGLVIRVGVEEGGHRAAGMLGGGGLEVGGGARAPNSWNAGQDLR